MEYLNKDRRMLLDRVVYNGFEDFANKPYILSDDAEDYYQNDFLDVNQSNDQDEEKWMLIANINMYPQKNKMQGKIFIHFFRSGKYLTANLMYESRKLNWSRRKIYDTCDYYKLYY